MEKEELILSNGEHKWINKESVRKEIIDYMLTILKREDVIDLQQKVDDYFLSTWKEIGYIFIPDSELINSNISEWTCTENGNLELETKLLRLGFAFREEDAKNFTKTYSTKEYEVLNKKLMQSLHWYPYVSITFKKGKLTKKDLEKCQIKENARWKINITKKVFWKNIPPITGFIPFKSDIDDEFEKYIDDEFEIYSKEIEDLGLKEYYSISKETHSIKVKEWSEKDLRDTILQSLKSDLVPVTENDSIQSVEDMKTSQWELKKIHGKLFFLKDITIKSTQYINTIDVSSKGYLQVNPKKIESNTNIFHSDIRTLKFSKKPGCIFDKWFIEKEWDFFLRIPWVTNFSTLKKWLEEPMLPWDKKPLGTTSDIAKSKQRLLEAIYYKNLIGITLTWRKDTSKKTGTWTQFFKIRITDLKSMISASLKEIDPIKIFELSSQNNSYTDDTVDFSRVERLIKIKIKKHSYDDANSALALRLSNEYCKVQLPEIRK